MVSLEELKAERARRQGQNRSAASFKMNKPSWQDIEIKLPFSKGINENIAGAVHGANRGFSKIFGFGKHVEDMRRNYERSKELNPFATEMGNLGANVASSIPFFMGGGLSAARLAPQLGRVAQGAIGGGLGGGAMGAMETPEDEESRLLNTLFGAGAGAGLGALFPAAKAAPKAIGDYAESLSQPRTVNKMLEHFNKLQGKYQQGYGDIFNNANMPQKLNLNLDKKSVKKLEKLIPGWNENLKKAVKSKNPLDVHWAQSDLGRLTRQIKKRGIDMTPQQREILEMAKPIQKQLKGTLKQALPSEAKGAYKQIGKEYSREMGDKIPQRLRNAFKDYEKGEIRPEDVLRRARSASAEKYQTKYGHLFPGISRARYPSVLGNAAMAARWPTGLGLAGGALYKGSKLLTPPTRKEQY